MKTNFQLRSTSKIDDKGSLSPLLERLYSSRGITSIEQIDYRLKKLINPKDIYQLTEAAYFLSEKIKQQKHVLIIGDYDADGATSTALVLKGLTLLGLKKIDFILPDRMTEGYGLSVGLVERVLRIKPEVVITVDTGISSIEGIATLIKAGIEVLVTDHHLPAATLPNANFILNPNAYKKDQSPNGRCLAGVGVAFYLLMAVRTQLRQADYFGDALKEPNLALLLDLVALGTVADLVPLDYLNRILVAQGLSLIQQNKCCDGIRALFQVSRKNQAQANQQDLGFAIAPKINAAGRIDNMSLGVQCLLASGAEANALAEQLNDINSQRRALQTDMQIDSDDILNKLIQEGEYPKGLVLSRQDWHEGVVGIVASQIKGKTNRPVFVFAHANNNMLKGSGRSITGIHLRDVLDLMDKRNDGLIMKFGGHAMAAGLSIHANRLDDFKQSFNSVLNEQYDNAVFLQNRFVDGELTAGDLNLETAEAINQAGPWGQLFEEPEFIGTFQVLQFKILKQQHIKFVLSFDNSEQSYDAIAFFCDEDMLKKQFNAITICYKLAINEFKNQRSLQLMISEFIV